MTSDLARLLLKLYEPSFRDHFKDHPRRGEILEKMTSGEYSSDEVDRLFEEASAYTTMRLLALGEQLRSTDGSFVFRKSDTQA
ncbi:hypothetical protein [Streptomyces tubercidicus]|uniref:hypothetical protein n=1 Tax=Streptomyces tubercidicus TaxID=47759 RepID=UPI00369A4C1C